MSDIPSMGGGGAGGSIPPMSSAPDEPQVLEGEHAERTTDTWQETLGGLFGFGKKSSTKGQDTARNLLSVGEMQAGVPAMIIGSGEDALVRMGREFEGKSHAEGAAAGNRAYESIMNQVGSPLHKVLKWAGIGGDAEGDQSPVDRLMGKADEMIAQGGEKAEKASGGMISADDVKSLAHAAMAVGGAAGMKAGLRKLASRAPELTVDALKGAPEVEQAQAYKEVRDSQDPQASAKAAEEGAQQSERAAEAKTRIIDPKELVLDPIKGLSEKVPDMGKELPKPSTEERALEKMSRGQRFDLTAEERVALHKWEGKPLDKPIIDESGKILDRKAYEKGPGYRNAQRGSISLGVPDFIVNWAKGTKVVDQKGAPKQVFHGTSESFDRFSEDEFGNGEGHADWGDGFYFTDDPKAAEGYAPGEGGNVRPAYLNLKNPATLEDIKADPQLRDAIGDPELSFLLHKRGYDGVAIKHPNGAMEYVAFDSKQIHGRFSSQEGSIDPKLMARLAAVGLGAWAGNYFSDDKSVEDSLLGAGAALGASMVPVRKVVGTFKKMFSEDTRIKINDLADAHEKYTRLAAIDVWSLQKQIEKLVPKVEDRNAITHAIEAGDLSTLTKEQQAGAKIAKDYFNQLGSEASLEGVLKSARDDYVTHIWDWSKNKGLFQKWMDRGTGAPGMGTYNRFGDARTIPTLKAGMAQGLTPLTEDISTIMGIYGNSMSRSIANSVFTRALREEKVPGTDQHLVMPTADAPHYYESINNPNLMGLRVHPDIAPSLKMLYDTSSPGAAMKIIQGISDTSKRVAVSFSLFHAKALTDALIGGSKITKIPGNVGRAWKGAIAPETNMYLQELKKGSASPLVERAVEGGLKFSLEGEGAGVEDAGASFYNVMKSVRESLDEAIPHAGAPIKGIEWMNHKVDNIMWARLHAGMKLNVFAEKYQGLIDNAAKAGKPLTNDQAARIAASYTNDLFGGLNWRRVAEDSKTRFGREVGQAMLNPGARRVLGILMFAPDWTISTTRAAVKAFGKPDFLRPTTLAGLHQQYLLRAAAYYLIVGDAINYQMSGHHLWENKDPTVLDMDPKGERHMQWSKHTMEPVHWVTKPAQQALNKLGMLPREALSQGLSVEYLSAKGRMPPMQSRLGHLAKNFAPISAQQADQGGAASVVSGFAGVPIYGKTAEQKKKDREARAKLKKHKP